LPPFECFAAASKGHHRGIHWLPHTTGPRGSRRSSGSRPSRSAWTPKAWPPGTTRAKASSSGRRRTRPPPLQVYGLTDYHAKNAIALGRLRRSSQGKVEVLQLPVPVLRDLRKLSAEVAREESEKTPWPGRFTRPSRSSRRWWALGPRRGRRLPPVRRGVRRVMTERRRFIATRAGL
jgi:hypothetical protein